MSWRPRRDFRVPLRISWVARTNSTLIASLAATQRLEHGRYYNGAAILRDHGEAYRCVRPNRSANAIYTISNDRYICNGNDLGPGARRGPDRLCEHGG